MQGFGARSSAWAIAATPEQKSYDIDTNKRMGDDVPREDRLRRRCYDGGGAYCGGGAYNGGGAYHDGGASYGGGM